MPALTGQSSTRGRIWIVAVIALILIAGHGFILYTTSKHLALSAGLVAGVAVFIVIKHLGFLGPVFARTDRGQSRNPDFVPPVLDSTLTPVPSRRQAREGSEGSESVNKS